MADEEIDIRVRLRDVSRFQADSKRAARSIDDVGDKAAKAALKFKALSKASADTRLNLGPFSVRAKTGALALGAFSLGLQKATPALLGFAEATATVVGGAGAAGAVGLLALGQGFAVSSIAANDLTSALGGNEAAMKRLTPAARSLFDTLSQKQTKLKGTIGAALFPGLEKGTRSALKNFGTVNRVAGRTGRALGGLAGEAGGFLGSKAFGADLSKVGNTNVRILTNLGHAGLSLANAARSILVSAAPLAEWLSELAERGSKLLDNWIQQKRAGGDLHRFFEQAKTDMRILGSITGHTGRGLINLFGSHDVDGTKTLRSLERLTAGFERWSRTAKTGGVGKAIADQIPKAGGLIASALAHTIASAVPQAARIFWESFWNSDAAGKALIGSVLLKKSGLFGLLGKSLGGKLLGGGAGAVGAVTRKAPLPVFVTNPGFGPRSPAPPVPTGSRAARVALNAAKSIPVLLPFAAGVELGRHTPHAVNPNLSPTGPVRGGRGVPIQIQVHSHLEVSGREIARARTDFDLANEARNAAARRR